ncbi:MAG: DUF4279 domain-containing protein [Chloroflexota bacterium]
MTELKSSVLLSFSIHSETVHPDTITEVLDIRPDKFGIKGHHRFDNPRYAIRGTHFWGLNSRNKVERSSPIGEHMTYLLDLLYPHSRYLAELSKTAELRFLCTITHGNHIFLDKDTIHKIADIGAFFNATVLNWDDDDED